jgi:DNA-binding transcriptional MerR regulator
MPLRDKPIGKLYYPISEVAELMDVNASTLRYWEKEFDNIRPHRNKKGNRFYTASDIESIRMIRYLLKDKGFTIQGARDQLKSHAESTKKSMDVVRSLESIKDFLIQIRDEL